VGALPQPQVMLVEEPPTLGVLADPPPGVKVTEVGEGHFWPDPLPAAALHQ